ncbi:hypothetical protein SDC9_153382 [bioreactor metagenome]|uniref:Uncharacterized protein n=1 Tax=bioreactor metagenome TaxID=1076179 RepID=A0A645EW77_9ZZZZ
MSNLELIIEEKAADIGNFLVGRLLPFREKRAVGPFVFIDHMGPQNFRIIKIWMFRRIRISGFPL